jgi:CheY-like chemotaxis protein
MPESLDTFGKTARSLARNPLGIIALFIVLVYGFAALVTAFASSFSPGERLPLIYFLVLFPILVLIVFAWLVSKHSGKLFAPSDFKNEDNYVKLQATVISSLAAASAKGELPATEIEVEHIVKAIRGQSGDSIAIDEPAHTHVLWVDDRPQNNIYERKAFEAVGLRFTLAESTDEALNQIKANRFAAIISDMGRREGPREGYKLLDTIRERGDTTPFFIYASSDAPEHKRETVEHGGQGCTNNPPELFRMVTTAVIRRGAA